MEYSSIFHLDKEWNLYFRNLTLDSIVQVEESPEPENKSKRYFVEIDVTESTTGEQYRVSEYLLVHPNQSHCLLGEYEWSERSVINIVLVVKNQEVWIRHLIDTLNSE